MSRMEKIASIENQVEALCLEEELQASDIPYFMRSYYDSAYDGLFQYSAGWGHVEAPPERRDEVIQILQTIRLRASEQDSSNEGADDASEE